MEILVLLFILIVVGLVMLRSPAKRRGNKSGGNGSGWFDFGGDGGDGGGGD